MVNVIAGRLNGITPPVGTLLPGIEPVVVMQVIDNGVWLRKATSPDFELAGRRMPRQVHSVYEHKLIPRRMTVFGLARVMG